MNLSRERGEDFHLVLTRYGLERLLYRRAESPHASEFVLKGPANAPEYLLRIVY